MGMELSIYFGPFITTAKDFEWERWESLVIDGRMEAGIDDDCLILIPNAPLEGITRSMEISRTGGEFGVCRCTPAMIVREQAAFARLAAPIWKHCDENDITIYEGWGIVPCWS